MQYPSCAKLFLLIIAVMLCMACGSSAQMNDDGDFTIRGDEVRLEGTVRAIDRITRQFVLHVDVTVSQGSEMGEIAAPGPHRVQLDYATTITDRRTGVQVLTFDNIGQGGDAVVIGQPKGNGTFITARVVILSRPVQAKPTKLTPLTRRQRILGSSGSGGSSGVMEEPSTVISPSRRVQGLNPRRIYQPQQSRVITPRKSPAQTLRTQRTVRPKAPTAKVPATEKPGPKSTAPKNSGPKAHTVISPRTVKGDASNALSQAPHIATTQSTPTAATRPTPSPLPTTPAQLTAVRPPAETRASSAAQSASRLIASAPPHQASKPTPRLPSNIGKGTATHTPNPVQPVRAGSAPSKPQASVPREPIMLSALPRLNSRTIPTPKPPPSLDQAHYGGQSEQGSSRQASRIALTPNATQASQQTSQAEDGRLATNKSSNPLTTVDTTAITRAVTRAALNEKARTHFRTLKTAQDDVHYAYFSGGSAQEKIVALTFDDGPNPEGTPKILDILKQEGVPATFFIIGRNAEQHPEIVLRALAEGHSIGNHTYNHRQGAELTLEQWRTEIEFANNVIMRLVGAPTRWFRAPGCRYTPEALQAINDLSMVRVDTTNNSSDWDKRPADSILARVLSGLAPGNVILMHDPMPQTAAALPAMIREIKAQGYRFVSLEELALRAKATPGFYPQFRPHGQGIVIPEEVVSNEVVR